MTRQLFMILSALTFCQSPLRAGNEAGGSWVINRFRAKAYEALSQLCQTPAVRTDLTASEITLLEDRIGATPIRLSDDSAFQKDSSARLARFAVVERESEGPVIQLRTKSWEHFLNANADVYPDVLALYLTLIGKPHPRELAERNDFSAFVTRGLFPFRPADPGRGMPLLKLGEEYWKAIPGSFTAEQATESCERLNERRGSSSLARWSVPSEALVSPILRGLLTYVDSLPYKTTASYLVWLRGEDGTLSETKDLLEGRREKTAFVENGLVCMGQPR